MTEVSLFPHIQPPEFESACTQLQDLVALHPDKQSNWLSTEVIYRDGCVYLKIRKRLAPLDPSHGNTALKAEAETDADAEVEIEDEDEDEDEAPRAIDPVVVVDFDITLSPVYQVPVLYFSITEPKFRYPSMDALFQSLVGAPYSMQAKHAGVIGGITIKEHPFTNRPAFFIHPCKTAMVLQASVGNKPITPLEYLILWIGAMGASVGLTVPVELAVEAKDPMPSSIRLQF